ncbi:GNAT family N-acetyltransferase [Spirillospora sp. NPDC052269]
MTVTLLADPTATVPALKLRPWQPDDAEALAAAHRDPLLRERLLTVLDGEEEARRWIDKQHQLWSTRSRFSFAVTDPGATDRPLGHIVVIFQGQDEGETTTAEVGYWTSPEARGRGIAPRALETVSRWALDPRNELHLTRLELRHATGNHASCRVAEKCGYQLKSLLAPHPPKFPEEGHLHQRPAAPPA